MYIFTFLHKFKFVAPFEQTLANMQFALVKCCCIRANSCSYAVCSNCGGITDVTITVNYMSNPKRSNNMPVVDRDYMQDRYLFDEKENYS